MKPSCFFEKASTVGKTLQRLTNKKRNKVRIANTRNEKGDITTVSVNTERIIGQCYKQLYRNTFDNLDEMGQFFENHKLLLKATQDKPWFKMEVKL